MQQLRILFLSNGKLTHPIQSSHLTGQLHIKDQQNLTTIIGFFQQGKCPNADIYQHEQNKISNIQVQIREDVLYLGGSAVEEHKNAVLRYKGGYRGYKRHGFGTHYYEKRTESGIWNNGLKQGQSIQEEIVNQSSIIFTIVNPPSQPQVAQYQLKLSGSPYICTTYRSGNQLKQDLALLDISKWQQYLTNKKQEWLNMSLPVKIALVDYPPKRIQKFSFSQIKEQGKLTLDMAEAYLRYLYHSQQCQSNGPTIVFGIYTVFYYNKIYNINKDYETDKRLITKDQVNHSMLLYRQTFRIFRGFWKYIIVPLVLSEKYDHFSFARVTIHEKELACTYYDSLLPINNDYKRQKWQRMLSFYQKVIKKALIHQLLKDSKNEARKKQIQTMKFTVYQQFPQQKRHDKIFCGFYMLQGIADLMKTNTILFHNQTLNQFKPGILNKLKQLSAQKQS